MDNRRARSAATQRALMRAAEKLIADRGIENVAVRDIVAAAGQKNESALQYHFKHLKGLIHAIHAARDVEIQATRTEMLQRVNERAAPPSLREICQLMVGPAFQLARDKPDFRRYIKAFGHEITLTDKSAVSIAKRKGGASVVETGALLRAALSHLDDSAYQRRLDGALRFISASMVHQRGRSRHSRGATESFFTTV
ncbi:MAG: helix-turn-helix transcriptional regulator [Gammaproteobacteria bacterium]|nr:helix-turn-helix transcriptional regulator [Gammaproteobacteria bacterium]